MAEWVFPSELATSPRGFGVNKSSGYSSAFFSLLQTVTLTFHLPTSNSAV